MRPFVLPGVLLGVALSACRPNLGPPASLVQGTRVLAVRGTPPEGPPGGPGAGVVYDVLIVGPGGSLPASTASWSYCLAPHPPAENNSVSELCLGSSSLTALGTGASAQGVLPDTTCQLFGPLTPPAVAGQPPGRPPDPDGTGGYYQPVRVDLSDFDGGVLTSIGQERITCGLAGVTADVAAAYQQGYAPNQNPVLAGVTATWSGQEAQPLLAPDAGAPLAIPAGAIVTLTAAWPASSVESFPVFDLAQRTLVTQEESLTTSWFAGAGSFALDEVLVLPDAGTPSASIQWSAPIQTGPVHLWVVLRDSRGGVDFVELMAQVN